MTGTSQPCGQQVGFSIQAKSLPSGCSTALQTLMALGVFFYGSGFSFLGFRAFRVQILQDLGFRAEECGKLGTQRCSKQISSIFTLM